MGKEYSDLDSLELQENSKMLIISILGIAILFVADLYVMINNPGNFVVFSIITILMLVWIFIFTRQMVKFQQQKRKKETEQLEELFRGQKANYLQQKKVSEQIAEVKTLLQHASVEDIVTAQKALAKVTISRSRENAEALMNSNDEVRQKMNQLLEDVSAVSEKMSEQQKAMIDEHIKGMLEREEQILGKLQEIDDSVKNEISEAVEKLQTVAVTPAAEPMPQAAEPVFEPEAVEEPLPELEPEVAEESLPELEPEAVEEPLPELEPEVTEEPLPELEPEVAEKPLPELEPEATEEPEVAEEPLPDLDFGLDLGSDLLGEPEATEATAEEPVLESEMTEEPLPDLDFGLDFGNDLLGESEGTEEPQEETASEEAEVTEEPLPDLDFGLDLGSDLLGEPEVTEATAEEPELEPEAAEEPLPDLDFGLDLGSDLLGEPEATEAAAEEPELEPEAAEKPLPDLDFGLDLGSDLLGEPEATETAPEETVSEEPTLDFSLDGLDLGNDLLGESETAEEPVAEVSEDPALEETPVLEDKVDVETLPPLDSNQIMEEEARLDSILADIQGMEMPDLEEPVVEEDAVEEPVTEEAEPAVEEIIPEDPIVEESVSVEPAVEEVVPEEPVPVVEEAIPEEPVVEEAVPVEPTPEPVAEDPAPVKAPAPENPNKIMTPDEIAALIANL